MAATEALRRYELSQLAAAQQMYEPSLTDTVLETVYAPLENGFAAVGLGSPLLRFSVVAVLSAGLLQLIKPSLFFVTIKQDTGSRTVAKRWSLLEPDSAIKSSNPTLYTAVPWWLASLLFAGALALLI
jgi:hypothetical protein